MFYMEVNLDEDLLMVCNRPEVLCLMSTLTVNSTLWNGIITNAVYIILLFIWTGKCSASQMIKNCKSK